MRRTRLFACLLVLILAGMMGCSGFKGTITPLPGTSAVSLTVRDTPPTGVTVISFQASMTGAALNPGGVDLLAGKGPINIEVKRLEVERAFLSTANVTASLTPFTSLILTFANPQLTFKNDTGTTLTFGGVPCLNGAVCEVKPPLTGTLTTNVSLTPPLVVRANAPTGLLVDLNLNKILSSTLGVDFGATGNVGVLPLPLPGIPAGQLDEVEDLVGVVTAKDATKSQFTLQTTKGNFIVTVDSATQFEDFDKAGCPANNFTCLQNPQVVEANLKLMAAGTFLARKIEFEDPAADDELEGVVFSIDSLTQFRMVVVDELRAVTGLNMGNVVTVTLAPGTKFVIDADGLTTVPATLRALFEGATDTSQLMPGQTVQVRVRSLTPGPPIIVSTNRLRLRMSRFTARVTGAPLGSLFNVDTLPQLFQSAGITQILVQTSSLTKFEGVTDVSGLGDPNTVVSLRGLLLKGLPNVLVASKVRKR